MSNVPKLWCVKLIRPLKGNRKHIQALAKDLGLVHTYKPTVLPNIPSYNERLHQIRELIHIEPLIIAPNSNPYADHPMIGSNGVFYPSADKLTTLHHKYGDTSANIDFPSFTPEAIKRDILEKYRTIFDQTSEEKP